MQLMRIMRLKALIRRKITAKDRKNHNHNHNSKLKSEKLSNNQMKLIVQQSNLFLLNKRVALSNFTRTGDT